MEKPYLMFTYNEDTLCEFLSDLIDLQHSLGSYHNLGGIGLCESRPFFRLSNCPLPLSF